MKSYFARLSPLERRFVVGVGVLLFIILNMWLVWPKFFEWGRVKARMEKARKTALLYEAAIRQAPAYQAKIKQLESEGADVPFEDQATRLLETIRLQCAQSGVNFISNTRPQTSTNQNFIDQFQNITVQSGEKQLVDFLYNLGAGNSLIRVRDLTLHPDPTRTQLSPSITLVASYQRKPSVRGAPSAAPVKTATPAAKPPGPAVTPKASPSKSPAPGIKPGSKTATNKTVRPTK
jgi:hypothetical protein